MTVIALLGLMLATGAAAPPQEAASCGPPRDLSVLLEELERVGSRAALEPSCEEVIRAGRDQYPDAFPVCAAGRAIADLQEVASALCESLEGERDLLSAARIQAESWHELYEGKVADVKLLRAKLSEALEAKPAARQPLLSCGAGPAAALAEKGRIEGRIVIACVVPLFRLGK